MATERSGLSEERWRGEVRVPDAAGQHRVAPPDRVDGDPLVQVEAAHSVELGDVDELVAGLLLVDEPRLGANLARRNGDQGPQRRCDDEPATAEQHCSRERNGDRRDQQRAPSPDRRDQHERGEERPEQAAHRRERVEPPGDGAGVPDVLDTEPHRERRDHAEQDHRRREEREHGEEGADRRARRRPGRAPSPRRRGTALPQRGRSRSALLRRPRCGRGRAGSGCGPPPFRPASSRRRARRGRGR